MKHKDNANQSSRKMKGQSRMQDTGNIYTRYRTTTKQTKNQKQLRKKMGNTDPNNKPGLNTSANLRCQNKCGKLNKTPHTTEWNNNRWSFEKAVRGNQNPYIKDNTMVKRKSTKGQTTIYKTYT